MWLVFDARDGVCAGCFNSKHEAESFATWLRGRFQRNDTVYMRFVGSCFGDDPFILSCYYGFAIM